MGYIQTQNTDYRESMMTNKTKFALIGLNSYTILLIGFFLVFNQISQSLIATLLLTLIYLIVSFVLLRSNQKEIRVHYIVGKSRKSFLKELFLLSGSTQILTSFLFALGLWLFSSTFEWLFVLSISFITSLLLLLQVTLLSQFLRRIL